MKKPSPKEKAQSLYLENYSLIENYELGFQEDKDSKLIPLDESAISSLAIELSQKISNECFNQMKSLIEKFENNSQKIDFHIEYENENSESKRIRIDGYWFEVSKELDNLN